jgi:hypothetical protein
VGIPLAEALEVDLGSDLKRRLIARLIKDWLKDNLLEEYTDQDSKRMGRRFIRARK